MQLAVIVLGSYYSFGFVLCSSTGCSHLRPPIAVDVVVIAAASGSGYWFN